MNVLSPLDVFTDEFFQQLLDGTAERYGFHRIENPDTPTESPIEDELEHMICKCTPDGSRVTRQFRVPTYRGTFRIDFGVQMGNRIVGFEADGRKYHDWRRDIFRDAVILGDSNVEAIYRIEGPDIYYRLETALYILGRCRPNLFSARGVDIFEAMSECRGDDFYSEDTEDGIYASYDYVDCDDNKHHRRITLRCLSREHRDFQFMVDAAKRYRQVKTEDLSSFTLQELMQRLRTMTSG